MPDPVITATALTKKYKDFAAVDGIDFEVAPGESFGLLGPNGAGKSTTMRMIAGLITPSSGRIRLEGKLSAMIEEPSFYPYLSGLENLRYAATLAGIPQRMVGASLERVGLTERQHSRVSAYSQGMRQRLGLARTLMTEPDVLLLDEPTNGLDPQGISWLRGFLRAYADQGRTVLVSSHQLAEMAQVADRLVVIGRGRLIADMTVAAFEAQWSSVRSVCVRTPEPERLAGVLTKAGATVVDEDGRLAVTGLTQERVGDLAGQAGLVLHELSGGPAALEAAFLEATSGVQQHPLATGVSA